MAQCTAMLALHCGGSGDGAVVGDSAVAAPGITGLDASPAPGSTALDVASIPPITEIDASASPSDAGRDASRLTSSTGAVTLPDGSVPTPPPALPSADDSCRTPPTDPNWSGLKNEPIFWNVTAQTVTLGADRQATATALLADADRWVADPRIYLDDTNGPSVAGGLESGTFRRFTDTDGDGRVDAVGLRFLYTEGNEAIKRASALAFAFNQTRDPKYLAAMLALGDSLMRLPSWNGRADDTLVTAQDGTQRRAFEFDNAAGDRDGVYQRSDKGLEGHGLDAAHVATAASMILVWAGPSATPEYRQALAGTIINQYLRPYYCNGPTSAVSGGVLGTGTGNWYTIIHTTALMASLAVMSVDDTWASASAARAASYLNTALDDLAYGPSDESYLYTAYELQWIGYLAATQRSPGVSATLRDRIVALIPNLSALSRFYASCGALAEPGFNDSGIRYRHNSRPLGLAAVSTFRSSPQIANLFATYQPASESDGWTAYIRDGLAEILWAQPHATPIANDDQLASAYGHRIDLTPQASGCIHSAALAGGIRAWMEGNANDAPHAHQDFGSVVADFGADRVLYNVPGDSTRPGTVSETGLHNTVGWLGSAGATQAGDGSVRFNYWRNPGAAGRAVPATITCSAPDCAHSATYQTYSGAVPSIITDSTALFTGSGTSLRKSTWSRELFADGTEGMGRVVVRDVITSARTNPQTLRWTWYVPASFALEVRNSNTFIATVAGRSYALITSGAGTVGTETFGDTNAGNDLWRITVDRTINENETLVGGIRVVRY